MPYVHVTRGKGNAGKAHQILTPKSLTCFEGLKNKGENVYIDTLTYEVFGILTELDMKKCFLTLDEERQKEKFHREEDNELWYASEPECRGRE